MNPERKILIFLILVLLVLLFYVVPHKLGGYLQVNQDSYMGLRTLQDQDMPPDQKTTELVAAKRRAKLENFAFCILSGSKVVVDRISGQYNSWLRRIPLSNWRAFIDDDPSLNLTNHIWADNIIRLPRHPEELLPRMKNEWDRAQPRVLPSLVRTHDLFPDKPWTVLIDDDSYVFVDNLMRWVDNTHGITPDKPILAGVIFCGWQYLYPDKECHWFPQGGPGVLLSRNLMDIMRPHWLRCERELFAPHEHVFVGDMRIGYCMEHVLNDYRSTIRWWRQQPDLAPGHDITPTGVPVISVHKTKPWQHEVYEKTWFPADPLRADTHSYDLSAFAYLPLFYYDVHTDSSYLLHYGHQLRMAQGPVLSEDVKDYQKLGMTWIVKTHQPSDEFHPNVPILGNNQLMFRQNYTNGEIPCESNPATVHEAQVFTVCDDTIKQPTIAAVTQSNCHHKLMVAFPCTESTPNFTDATSIEQQ